MSIKDMYTQRNVEQYKSPEIIPEACKKCNYFKKTGIIDIYRGHCLFFNEDRFSNWSCIVFAFLEATEDPAQKEKIRADIKQRLLPKIELKNLPSYQINDDMSLFQILFSFEGRINRYKYWIYVLYIFSLSLIALSIDIAVLNTNDLGVFSFLFSIMSIIPNLAMNVKRCHDRDLSGWIILVNLIPIIGCVLYFIDVGLGEGTNGDNRFGTDPLRKI